MPPKYVRGIKQLFHLSLDPAYRGKQVSHFVGCTCIDLDLSLYHFHHVCEKGGVGGLHH